MKQYIINGGNRLSGIVENQTSKNASLPIIAGSLLASEKTILHKIPKLLDIDNMLNILKDLGVRVRQEKDDIEIDPQTINKFVLDPELSKRLRSSIFLLGPMLARFKKVAISYPGGCNIGNRPIDLHLSSLKSLGVDIKESHSIIRCDATKMHSGVVHLDFPSVGATENLIMSTVFLKGKTKIINPAKEPEIVDLQNFINSMGGKISGAGSSEIIIEGVKELKGIEYTPTTDRIVAGTLLIAGAMCGGDITIKNQKTDELISLINKLKYAGCDISYGNREVRLQSTGKNNSINLIETRVYPGFPTDMQALIMALQTVSNGVSVIVENIFENRFKHAFEMVKMGANIIVKDRVAVIRGVEELMGAPVDATDLRGGAGLVLCGLKAKGYTTVNNVQYIDRGYENLDKILNSLGADIISK